jgi:transcription-repair coupling factor (superfamily II helicase)
LVQDGFISAAGDLFSPTRAFPAAQSLARRLEQGGALFCPGISSGAQPFLAALLQHLLPKIPVVLITDGLKAQESVHQDLQTWLPLAPPQPGKTAGDASRPPNATSLLFYPAWEVLPHEARLPHADVVSERLETLVALSAPRSREQPPVIVASVAALLQRTFLPGYIHQHTRLLQRGDHLEPLDLIEWLEDQGYEPEAQVTHKGEIALRGGIVDVFPLTSPWPIRLEFFGDELESLRCFDPITQISLEQVDSISLPPGGELGILKKMVHAQDEAASGTVPLKPLATLLDYLPKETIFLLCEPGRLQEAAANYSEQVPPKDPFSISWSEIESALKEKFAVLELVEDDSAPEAGTLSEIENNDCTLRLPNLDVFRPIQERAPDTQVAEAQRREFFSQLHRWVRQNFSVHVFCNNDGERQRFKEVWADYGLEESVSPVIADGLATDTERTPPARKKAAKKSKDHSLAEPPGRLVLHIGALTRGFYSEPARLVVVTDAEIFGRYKVLRPRRLKSPHASATRSALDINFAEIEEGDYVVHLQHGIGRYAGLTRLPPGQGRKQGAAASTEELGQEFLAIEYAPPHPDEPPPKLYVPVTEAHLVSKYVGAGKARPPLNTLGGTRWNKAKAQAERAVRDLAAEFLSIQAAREFQTGHSFPQDAPWQRDFEGAFLYEETPDQLRAIHATKADMESLRPMDRLICGDVGFGKTEVAIRAAFKAVLGGKQVAILVPTTVLAQQHYNTFRERMADYPVRVELLSRFRTRKEQRRVLENLAAGTTDIVIGTHRLVQEDVAFKDLGLVVIDEEQRFGVLHKERLKKLRTLVDVLTLSATPIPRTLYLALTGARDMSTIETPPQDRLPVETIVTQYDERVIRDAIQREINRGGQVFFLHNRVFDIESVAHRLRGLLPRARILVGHGQMHSDDLEEVMTKFVNGEADVLLSTTIIESGLDIPNANTIIIDRADRFGLSDLYQLRGRVGRYKHQAYAYLLLPRHAGLLVDARKRISAIKQYSTLGSGFKIAMRDLEIRGAGNLLGPEQSGHISAVGFELYCQLLKQSISALKGEKVKPRVEVQLRLDFIALSPAEEISAAPSEPRVEKRKQPKVVIPREIVRFVSRPEDSGFGEAPEAPLPKTAAYIPHKYIPEPQHRIEIYRKLAQAGERAALDMLEKEIRDRFGPLPPGVELLIQITDLKIVASGKAITQIETRGNKLMVVRYNDYIMERGKFPRLTKQDAAARLGEIKQFISTQSPDAS